MKRKSHIYFAAASLPLFFIPINIYTNIKLIDIFFSSYNYFINFTMQQIINCPLKNLGLIIVALILYLLGSIFQT